MGDAPKLSVVKKIHKGQDEDFMMSIYFFKMRYFKVL